MSILQKLLERKKVIGLMVALILVLGIYSISKMDRELMPSVAFDMAMITVDAGDMPVRDVENLITEPVEKELAGIDGVTSYDSSTAVGSSSFFIDIEEGRVDEVTREIESHLTHISNDVTGIVYTDVRPISTDQSYEFYMEVSNGEMNDLTSFANEVVKPRLENLNEVREVNLNGLEETEYVITFDQDELRELGLELSYVVQALQQTDVNVSLGELTEEDNEPSLRWNTELSSLKDIEEATIDTPEGPIDLKDMAEIDVETLQQSSMAWKNGSRDVVFVEIARADDYTQVEMAEAIRDEVAEIHDEGLASELSFTEIVAQADYVSSSIDGVTQNILIGGVLALVILMLFLRNSRATLIVGLSIPVSLLLTFTTLWFMDYSFNILTLIGLGLGIGMMVDASIVILESIYRKKEEGLVGIEAVMTGIKEVATAVIASMLTTVVVFLPVGLFGGDFAIFILVLSVVVVITLVSSVIVAFTLIPALAENFMKLRKKAENKRKSRIIERYGSVLNWFSQKKRRRYGLIMVFFLIFVGSIGLTTKIPFVLMPDVLNRYSEMEIRLETGLTAEDKDKVVEAAEEKLTDVDDIESVVFMDAGDYLYALINMTKDQDITVPQEDVNLAITDTLRELEDDFPVTGVFTTMDTGGGGQPVQLIVQGDSLTKLQDLSSYLSEELEEVDGLVNVSTSMDEQVEERQLVFDHESLKEDGLTTTAIYEQLQGVFAPLPVGEIVEEGTEIPVVATFSSLINSEKDLEEFDITGPTGTKPLSNYAELENVSSPITISRTDGARYVTVSAEIEGRDLGAVTRDVQTVVDELEPPAGYAVSTGGDIEAQQEMMLDLVVVLGISILLVYIVMAVQFNSFIQPIIVMSVIPMTAVGAILALLITQRELSVFSALALLMLIGVVLNNAILLIDRINQLREQGLPIYEAVIEAGKNRMRPIFMTTLTTVGGMLPLALATGGANAYQAPLATVIIGGLLFATFITLLLIPAVYLLVEDIKRAIKRVFSKKKTSDTVVKKAS
ncbi:efflux RND transporter permease subunit [Salipaludibacillus agaradhaerens]|uniref:Efflux RND transporter permease subunit n=1 Tax=Salipaludibacillus agaradhaerens TaxID=76935 RepID=A0A9Q4FZI2_SALAG|nr:efflux RND transporter permease subunit [Salipaludibacillus agaradhaerens]MCR6097142.1 efflux RND transporter permease subunit [Salipaludibacillus agaradhaerens]MCR6113373.1 efflux RND transporter permease subunit [Salipaludibacillus agaradhaerens]